MPNSSNSPDLPSGRHTAPLGLVARLAKPEIKIDFLPLIDLAVIALIFSLFFTRFVALPGVRVDLPKTDLRTQHAASNVVILTIGNEGAIYFDGGIYDDANIAGALRKQVEGQTEQDVVLLIKAQGGIDLQRFLNLCQMAKEAGYPQIQIIGDRVRQTGELVPDDSASNQAIFR